MRAIDADKLPITNTYALVNSKDVKPNEISFAPLVCVLKSDIDNAPTIEHEDNSKLHYAIGYNEGYTDGYKQAVIELKHGLERRLRGDV